MATIKATSPLSALIAVFTATTLSAQAKVPQQKTYSVDVAFTWSPETHPIDFPDQAHWSGMFVVTHNSRYSLFADGHTATTGLALLATNGRFNILQAEYDEAHRRRRVATQQVISPPSGGSGTFSFEVEATAEHALLSFATMIAPSPDWFSGAASIALFDGDAWIEEAAFPIFVWDAGSDSGEFYTASNAISQPRESIRLLAHPAFLQRDGLRPIGTVTVRSVDRAQKSD